MSQQKPKSSTWSRHGYLWVTLILFLGSMLGHWTFAWPAFVDEQMQNGAPPEVRAFVFQMLRDTFENWQSEFLQLIWQVGGLAWLYHIGSPSSKEGNDRMEEKIDLILKAVDKDGEKSIHRLDRVYQRD